MKWYLKMKVLEHVYKYQMKLGNSSSLETLTHELYEKWEIGFEILKDKGSILCSYSGQSDLKKVMFEITGVQSDYCQISG